MRSQPGLRHHRALAVRLAAAGADRASAGQAGAPPGPAHWRVREAVGSSVIVCGASQRWLREVDVADARAAVGRRADAGVAVAAAGLVREEAAADAGVVQAQGGIDVGDRLAGAGDAGVRCRCRPCRGPTRGRRSPRSRPCCGSPPARSGRSSPATPSQNALQVSLMFMLAVSCAAPSRRRRSGVRWPCACSMMRFSS